ncbi:hypothetical protein AAFF_G00331700 [Aldrovandia affinis]|uniref:Uncharacterized protein n=1 Tax=Aldrovandia affinis TaxID=143900 RepID=A0AAD7SLN5_9TELE|nr:hypothetical protein AAFF_G00331700 [Aldrovandia affinis]
MLLDSGNVLVSPDPKLEQARGCESRSHGKYMRAGRGGQRWDSSRPLFPSGAYSRKGTGEAEWLFLNPKRKRNRDKRRTGSGPAQRRVWEQSRQCAGARPGFVRGMVPSAAVPG